MYIGAISKVLGDTVRQETKFVATNNQTTFFPTGGYQPGYVDVFIAGQKKTPDVDFTATNGSSVVTTSPVTNNDIVLVVAYGPAPLASVVSRTGDAMTGDLTVPNVTVTANVTANVVDTSVLDVGANATVNSLLTITGNTIQTGDITLTGNINLTGSLIITGAATSVSTESLSVQDTIISLGANNTSGDTLDIGFAGLYSNGTANVYAGLVRNATDKEFYFFHEYDEVPGNDVDLLDPSFAIANVHANFNGNLISNSVTSSVVNAGNVNLTSSLRLTGDATGYSQLSTTIYGGDATNGEGRFEYHDDSWILNAGSDSTDIALFQRGNLVKSYVNNDGSYIVGNTTIAASSLTFAGTLSANGTTGTSGYVLKSAGASGNVYWDVGGGGGGNAIGTIAVSGQANITSNSTNTILSVANGDVNIVITTNNTSKTLTLAVNTTPSFGNTTITGFANVTSTLAAGNTSITGTISSGNSTVTGFVNATANVTTGGIFNGDGSYITSINASSLSTGTVSTARLATTGTANSSTFLRGDQSWEVVVTTTDLGTSSNSTAVDITSSSGADITIASANATNAGVFSAADKSKLDGIASGAQVGTVTSVATANGLSGGTITSSGTISLALADGLFSNTTGLYVNATAISVGTVPTARLGSGTANSTTYLAGDQSWKTIAGGGIQTNDHAQLASLGVGTTAPGSGSPGEIRATGNVVGYYSDARLKTFAGKIDNPLEKVGLLNGWYYYENDVAKGLGYNTETRQVGVSAQEVQKVLPEIVVPAPVDPEYLTVQYHLIVPLLIEAIKELKGQVEELRQSLNNK